MNEFPEPLVGLIEALRKLPGVGTKTAQRLALHLMKAPREQAEALARAVQEVKARLRLCSSCFNITDVDPCGYCTATDRDDTRICVVEEPNNLVVIERTGQFKGRYHVLGGALSPIHGRGPDALHVEPLLERLRRGGIEEVILATNPNVEGEATATFLARLVKPLVPRVSRIAMGLPVGGDLDYVDVVTMTRAMDGRREL
jgi:recombination protein RecR